MVRLNELQPAKGSRQKRRRRVGRGIGSGHGKTAGRGTKGQKARSGGNLRPGFEGGQTPLIRRVPKRGFSNPNRVEYVVVNVGELNRFRKGSRLTPDRLRESGVAGGKGPIKILGDGELKKSLKVQAHAFSASAREQIEAVGGTVEVIPWNGSTP